MKNAVLSGREILVVDDEALLRKRLVRFLGSEGANVVAVSNFEEGKRALSSMPFDYALLDVHLPDGLGIDLLQFADGVSCVIMTADGGWEIAVEAMKRGAADYMAKPFEIQEIPLILARCASAKRSDRSRQHRMAAAKTEQDGDSLYFGDSLLELKEQLERILVADRRLGKRLPPVLLEGETGTGKSTFARWLHAAGPRQKEELVVVNCGALPESLAESELFGHEKGAFTDAKEKRIGLFEAADGGTLFLDEIASLSSALQAKVLVAIEEGQIRRVGGVSEILVDARVIAASNRGLKGLSESGEFREDLYHRLNLLHATIPPLRDRRGDILPLAQYLGVEISRRYRLDTFTISENGKAQLLAHDWPGNIRELSHEIERAIILGDPNKMAFPALANVSGELERESGDGSDWLDARWRFPEDGFDLESAIDRLIDHAINQADRNVSQASRLLGVPRDYIRYRKKKRSEELGE